MFQWCSHNGMAREQCTERNVHIISSYVYLSCRSPYMTVYGTERNGEKRNGLGTYSNVYIILVDDSVRSGTGYQKTHNRNMYMSVHIIPTDVHLPFRSVPFGIIFMKYQSQRKRCTEFFIHTIKHQNNPNRHNVWQNA